MPVENDAATRQLSLSFTSSLDQLHGIIGVTSVTTALPVPAPATYAPLLAGLGLIGASLRRRQV
jgi:hypothetical protein